MKKLLAIDDNKINLQYIYEILDKNFPEYEILLSESGHEGIKLARESKPEIILLDILMPEIDGFEVINRLKKDEETRRIPILLISALGQDTKIRIKGFNTGADAFLTKPFNQFEMIAQVNVLLRIKNAEDLLRKLNSQLSIVEEKERRRIAENLHDSLGQTLSLAFMKLSSLANENFSPGIHKTILESSELLHKAITESRALTYDLSPPILYELGLIPAIKWKLSQLEERYGLVTKFESIELENNFSKDIEIVVYRIVNELLSNIVKHAKANTVYVGTEARNTSYILSIEDDGKGFQYDPKLALKKEAGFGLISIKERLTTIGGRLEIDSSEGKGTKAIVILPNLKNTGYVN